MLGNKQSPIVSSEKLQASEENDPLVQKIAEEASMDPNYVERMNYLECDTEYNDIDPNCELKQMKESN